MEERSLFNNIVSLLNSLDPIVNIVSGIITIASVIISLRPSFFINPFISIITIAGVITYPLLLFEVYNFNQGTNNYKKMFYLFFIAIIGYYLVDFSKYLYGKDCLFFWIYTVVCCITALAFSLKNKNRSNLFILIVLFVSILIPYHVIYSSGHPKLVISPENKFLDMEPDQECTNKVTIHSTLDDAYNITLYADSRDEGNNLAVYVDEKEKGPFELEQIKQGNKKYTNVLIVTSPQITSGNYTIFLNSTYYDINKNVYKESNSFSITVHNKSDGVTQRILKIKNSFTHWISKEINILIQLVLEHMFMTIIIIIVIFLLIRLLLENHY